MSATDFSQIAALLENLYGAHSASLEILAGHPVEGRLVVHARLATGASWVARAWRCELEAPPVLASGTGIPAAAWLGSRGALLACLEAQHYPAPRVVRTRTGALTAEAGGWCALVATYVDGVLLAPDLAQLRRLGAALGRLHTLPAACEGAGPAWFELSRSVPHWLAALQATVGQIPARWRPLHAAFRATFAAFKAGPPLPRALIHGDAWAGNAVQRVDGEVLLLDWDTAGVGPAVLDLGRLLLECHLDREQPAQGMIRADPARISAVAAGYHEHREPAPAELAVLPEALRFGAAVVGSWHLTRAAAAGWDAAAERRLARAENRFAVSDEVARLARDALQAPA